VNSIEARVPFGDLDFVKYVMSMDPALKRNSYGMGKYLLRHAFEKDRLLPEEILWRQKAAFSDAVGHSMVDDLKAYAEARTPTGSSRSCAAATTTARPSPRRACSTGRSSSATTPARPG
jgi:asparagine synthase (glutamine-hydrolysing)